MIHIAIGTKAQFIKMASIIQLLQDKNIPFNLIDMGQHSLITEGLRKEFGIREPDVYLSRGENVSRLSQGLFWMAGILFKGLSSRWVKGSIFRDKKGVCLIHGDTISTLLALYLARRAGVKVAHVEGGLRSNHLFEPFPEEMLRIWVMRLSDILFVPSEWAMGNLRKMGLDKKAVLVSANTSLESTLYSLNKNIDAGLKVDKYCLITVHRMENIFSRRRMENLLDLIEKTARKIPVVFVQHQPTIHQLEKFGLQKRLQALDNVIFFEILSHGHFISLLKGCEFVLTDGGSIQEESFYLNKPCLLLRRFSERPEGLDENVVISELKGEKVSHFLAGYTEFKRKDPLVVTRPSQEILDNLSEYVAA